MALRRTLLRWHVSAGVFFGLFWAIQGLTGAVLVFNRDLQAATLDRSAGGERLPLDMLVARAGKAIGGRVTRLETFGPDRNLMLAYAGTSGGDRVGVIDARSGALLETRDPQAIVPRGGAAWGWLLKVHEALLGGDVGAVVVGVSGTILLFGIGVGLWNALPYRRWRNARRMTTMRGRARLAGWHRLVGLAVAPALLVMVACGVYLAFAPELRVVLANLGYDLPYKPTAQAKTPDVALSAEGAYAVANRHFPGATLMRLILPTAQSPVYLFRLLQPDDARRWAGTSTLAVDPASGRIVDAFDARTAPLANRLTDALYSIHTGDVAGWPGRLLVLFAGLSLPVFAVTGWLGWARSRRRGAA